jgi:DNA-binding FrmR family transcriptional regulator
MRRNPAPTISPPVYQRVFSLAKSFPELRCRQYTPLGVYYSYMKYIEGKGKAQLVRRLKLIEGQVRGLQKMIEDDTYCIDVITQTSAVKQGLSNVEDLLLENHLGGCIMRQVASGKADQAKEEILKVYKLKRK